MSETTNLRVGACYGLGVLLLVGGFFAYISGVAGTGKELGASLIVSGFLFIATGMVIESLEALLRKLVEKAPPETRV